MMTDCGQSDKLLSSLRQDKNVTKIIKIGKN